MTHAHALRPLLDFGRGGLPSRKLHADGQHVVFPFHCYLDTGGGEEGGELYTEQKFLQVKALVERLNGREGQAEVDARWRAKVTAVRHWFEVGAKKRRRADGRERELYRESYGKSGGENEELP